MSRVHVAPSSSFLTVNPISAVRLDLSSGVVDLRGGGIDLASNADLGMTVDLASSDDPAFGGDAATTGDDLLMSVDDMAMAQTSDLAGMDAARLNRAAARCKLRVLCQRN